MLQAVYIRVPASARLAVRAAKLGWRDGLHAASHAVLNCIPLHLLCEAGDMDTECDNPYDSRFRPERILLYDKHPGGIGLAAQVCSQRNCSARCISAGIGHDSCHVQKLYCVGLHISCLHAGQAAAQFCAACRRVPFLRR